MPRSLSSAILHVCVLLLSRNNGNVPDPLLPCRLQPVDNECVTDFVDCSWSVNGLVPRSFRKAFVLKTMRSELQPIVDQHFGSKGLNRGLQDGYVCFKNFPDKFKRSISILSSEPTV